MSYPNGGQPGQPQQWGQPHDGGQQSWGQAASTGFNNAKTGSGFNASNVRPGQWIALGLPILAIIALSLNFIGGQTESSYGYSYDVPGYSGWNAGIFVFMFILFVLAAVAAAIELFAPTVKLPFPMAFVTGGLLAIGGVMGLIKWLTGLDIAEYFGVGAWIVLLTTLVAIAGAVLEIMAGLKAPKTPAGNAQWGQTAGGGQWGQPAQPQVQGQQWGAPQTGGQPAQPQQQWGAPQTGGHQAHPQTGGQPAQPQQQWGQNPQQGQNGQWGQPQ